MYWQGLRGGVATRASSGVLRRRLIGAAKLLGGLAAMVVGGSFTGGGSIPLVGFGFLVALNGASELITGQRYSMFPAPIKEN